MDVPGITAKPTEACQKIVMGLADFGIFSSGSGFLMSSWAAEELAAVAARVRSDIQWSKLGSARLRRSPTVEPACRLKRSSLNALSVVGGGLDKGPDAFFEANS